jgi:hypothetical protein
MFLGAALAGAVARAANDDTMDDAWVRKFRAFVKQLNRFIEESNDGIFDAKQWKRVREAWSELDGKASCS